MERSISSSTKPIPESSAIHTRQRTAQDIIGASRIGEVYTALTGATPRRSGDRWRGPATWRGGKNLSVSGDDARNIWHDFVSNAGGGILDLIVCVQGCSRQDALGWLAAFVGVPLDDQPLSREDRQRFAQERQRIEQQLPEARRWRRAAVNMVEDLLYELKSFLFDPMALEPEVGEIYDVERLLTRLRRIDGAQLVEEYGWWAEHYPGTTAYMIRAIQEREQVEIRALCRYLDLPDRAAATYLRTNRSAA